MVLTEDAWGWLSIDIIVPSVNRLRSMVCMPGPQPMSRILGHKGKSLSISKALLVE